MSWRIVYIDQPCKLSQNNFQLNLKFEKGTIEFPLEDVAVVIIDTPIAIMTSALLSSFGEYNIVLVTCDKTHMPIYICRTMKGNSRQVQAENNQLAMTVPFKKRVWQAIVSQKIANQGRCLHLLGLKGANKILKLSREVVSGDSENAEAVAANQYFTMLFGEDFVRREVNITNIGLNYGYSIIRSLMARSLVGAGFILSRGVHHHSELNAYNLVDDFMEPYRPLVDYIVYKYMEENPPEDMGEVIEELPKELKRELLRVIEYTVYIDGKTQSIRRSTEIMANSFQTAVRVKDYKELKVPFLKEIKLYEYE